MTSRFEKLQMDALAGAFVNPGPDDTKDLQMVHLHGGWSVALSINK